MNGRRCPRKTHQRPLLARRGASYGGSSPANHPLAPIILASVAVVDGLLLSGFRTFRPAGYRKAMVRCAQPLCLSVRCRSEQPRLLGDLARLDTKKSPGFSISPRVPRYWEPPGGHSRDQNPMMRCNRCPPLRVAVVIRGVEHSMMHHTCCSPWRAVDWQVVWSVGM